MTTPTMPPDRETILITGAAGFIGQLLASALLHSNPNLTLILTDTVQPEPPLLLPNHPTAKCYTHALDLTEPTLSHPLLLAAPLTSAYLLHGLMSAGSERDLPASLAVNLDSHRTLLDSLRAAHPGLTVVFPSSIAALGPALSPDELVTERSPAPLPRSTYGAHKLMIETLVADYTRRGLLDGRIVRLPTVMVRPGQPSAAASSFVSGIVRESLRGVRNVLPVAEGTELWVCSPAVVVENLVWARGVDAGLFGVGTAEEGGSGGEGGERVGRVVNLPGRTVTVGEILAALEEVGGWDARGRVVEERDKETERIVASWPARFDTRYAQRLGFKDDIGLVENIRAFAKSVSR